MGFPTTFDDLNPAGISRERLMEAAVKTRHPVKLFITVKWIRKIIAMKAADAYGRKEKQQAQLNNIHIYEKDSDTDGSFVPVPQSDAQPYL